jgi:hypothetical protein
MERSGLDLIEGVSLTRAVQQPESKLQLHRINRKPFKIAAQCAPTVLNQHVDVRGHDVIERFKRKAFMAHPLRAIIGTFRDATWRINRHCRSDKLSDRFRRSTRGRLTLLLLVVAASAIPVKRFVATHDEL